MLWNAKNKKTGKVYPDFTDEQKAGYQNDPNLRDRYVFTAVPGSDKPKAPEPVEAKKITTTKPESEKE